MERSTTYFHNQIGILTEISGNPTPMEIGLVLDRQLPHGDVPLPIPPQKVWHFKQSIDYILSAQRAILDLASRNKDLFLYPDLADGDELDRAREQGQLDAAADLDRAGQGRGGQGSRGGARPGARRGSARRRSCRRSTTT